MWPFKKVSYKPQVLTDKQKELLNYIDSELSKNNYPTETDSARFLLISIPLQLQVLPLQFIIKNIKLEHHNYIPRSLALISNGIDWHIIAKVWNTDETITSIDPITFIMFSECLNRTNDARTIIDSTN